MNKPNLSKFFKSVKSNVSKHSPEILTGIGIAGMISTTILAVKATPRALDLIAKAEDEKKEQAVREKVAQKKVDEKPASTSEVIVTGNGSVLFLEPVSQRYFTSDIETIRKIINDLNYRLTTGMEEYISLSSFYDEIGLSHTAISDDIGWNINRDGQIVIDMPATKTDKGEPCLMLDYHVEPRYDYTNLN